MLNCTQGNLEKQLAEEEENNMKIKKRKHNVLGEEGLLTAYQRGHFRSDQVLLALIIHAAEVVWRIGACNSCVSHS